MWWRVVKSLGHRFCCRVHHRFRFRVIVEGKEEKGKGGFEG